MYKFVCGLCGSGSGSTLCSTNLCGHYRGVIFGLCVYCVQICVVFYCVQICVMVYVSNFLFFYMVRVDESTVCYVHAHKIVCRVGGEWGWRWLTFFMEMFER